MWHLSCFPFTTKKKRCTEVAAPPTAVVGDANTDTKIIRSILKGSSSPFFSVWEGRAECIAVPDFAKLTENPTLIFSSRRPLPWLLKWTLSAFFRFGRVCPHRYNWSSSLRLRKELKSHQDWGPRPEKPDRRGRKAHGSLILSLFIVVLLFPKKYRNPSDKKLTKSKVSLITP